jgi:hypothetical protein
MQVQLSKHAVLVSVNIINGGLLGERKDRQASELVQSHYQISDRRAKASKYLIDRTNKAVKRVVAASQRVREVVYRYSLPWGDEKMRLVTTKTVDEFRSKLKVAIDDLENAWDDYVRAYPDLKDQSELELGELFDPHQYPSHNEIKGLFKINVNYWPFPETGHFVADMSSDAANEARQNMENEIEERLLAATQDMVDRAQKVVAAFIEKVESVEATFEIDVDHRKSGWHLSGVIRDSLIDNIKDTADLIDRMNLTQSPQVAKVVKDLKRLCVFQVERWRAAPASFRDQKPQALTTANEILTQLNAINLRDQEINALMTEGGEYLD